MKISEIVQQLQLILPKYTDLFSTTLGVSSITATGGVATIITSSPHSLTTGQAVTISDIAQQNSIDYVFKDGLVFEFGVTSPHDLTYGYPGYETVSIDGFTDSSWNDDFTLVSVPSKYSFKVQSTNSSPTLNTNEYLNEVRMDGVNGRYSVTVVDTTTFTVSGTFNDGTYENGTIKSAVRIAGSASAARALEQYTKQSASSLWMFVVMDDAVTSKNRSAYNDAVATVTNGEDIRVRLVDGFSVFLVQSVKSEIAATNAVDVARHDLLYPITKSLFGTTFSTGLSSLSDFKAILTGHNFVEYDRSTFVYQYNFEFTYDLIASDMVEDTDTRAFSEIDYTQEVGGDDTTDMTVSSIGLREINEVFILGHPVAGILGSVYVLS